MTQKKVVEICYSNSMKINRANYEQEAPFYSAKTIIEENGQVVDEAAEYGRLRGIIDPLLEAQYRASKAEMAGVRIRLKDGKKYPSVTSILSPDGLPTQIDKDYGVRGNEIHRLINLFITEGKWYTPSEPLAKLTYEQIPYQEFFTKFKDRINLTKSSLNIEVFHDKHLYSGEIDAMGFVDDLLCLIDFKTGSWDWTQLVAYYKAYPEAKMLAIFDLKNLKLETLNLKDVKCPEYWEKFLVKRGEFRARFGV